MVISREAQLNDFLAASIEQLDISDADYALAVKRYQETGSFLSNYWEGSSDTPIFHPQGSMLLGTVTRVFHRNDEYDLDAVCIRILSKNSISQVGLKTDVGDGLRLFLESKPDGLPTLEERKRCWTLIYSEDPFHLDVLPALPDPDGSSGIIITDRDLRDWQFSNPLGFAEWFRGVMRPEWLEKRALLAKAMDIVDVPDWKVKTTLQRAVQALKRHRDIYFHENLDDRTASIIVTTLAARAYTAGGDLFDVLIDVSSKMPGLVERKDGRWLVTNPVQEKENFADRWIAKPHLAERFFEWIERAHEDFKSLGAELGQDRILEKLASSFGETSAKRAAEVAGTKLYDLSTKASLAMEAGTGTLGVGSGRTVPKHDFHGDS